jgi:hypothetical protein
MKIYQGHRLFTLIILRCLSVLPARIQNLSKIASLSLPSKFFLVRESSHTTLFSLRYRQAYKINYSNNIDSLTKPQINLMLNRTLNIISHRS